MNTFRKWLSDNRSTVIYVLILVFSALAGYYIAFATVYRYMLFVRAYLGVTIMYFMARQYIMHPKPLNNDIPFGVRAGADLKYLAFALWLSTTMFWAIAQILDGLRALIKLL